MQKIPENELPSLQATAEQLALINRYLQREIGFWRSMGNDVEDGVEMIGFTVNGRFNLDLLMTALEICQQAVEAAAKGGAHAGAR